MAINILADHTLGDIQLLYIDGDPRTSGGLTAAIGSLAMMVDSNSNAGVFQKTGSSDTSWSHLATTLL